MRPPGIATILLALAPGWLGAQQVDPVAHQEALDHLRDGHAAAGREDLAAAEREFKAALLRDPGLTDAHVALGQTYMALERYPDAVDAFTAAKHAIEVQIRQAVSGRSAAEQRARQEVQELRDSLRLLQGGTVKDVDPMTVSRIEERIRVLEQDRGKSAAGGREVPAELCFALGTAHLRTGNAAAAEREFVEAIRVKPGYGEAHSNLALALGMQARWQEASAELERAARAGFAPPARLRVDIAARHVAAPIVAERSFEISHEPIGCVAAGSHPRVEARITPGSAASRVRVRFRSAGARDWYSVAMERDDSDVFAAVLPPPLSDLPSFQYYVEATDAVLDIRHTREHTPVVRARPEDCAGLRIAEHTASSQAIVQAPPGAPAVPPGFGEPRRPKRAGASRVGVFGLGQYPSLGAGALVLVGSYEAARAVAHRENTPPLLATLVASDPPGGSLVVGTNATVSLRFRIEPTRDFEAQLSASLVQDNPGLLSPFVSCAVLTSPRISFRRDQPQEIVATGSAGGCSSVGHTELVIVSVVDSEGRLLFISGNTGSFPLRLSFSAQ